MCSVAALVALVFMDQFCEYFPDNLFIKTIELYYAYVMSEIYFDAVDHILDRFGTP